MDEQIGAARQSDYIGIDVVSVFDIGAVSQDLAVPGLDAISVGAARMVVKVAPLIGRFRHKADIHVSREGVE